MAVHLPEQQAAAVVLHQQIAIAVIVEVADAVELLAGMQLDHPVAVQHLVAAAAAVELK